MTRPARGDRKPGHPELWCSDQAAGVARPAPPVWCPTLRGRDTCAGQVPKKMCRNSPAPRLMVETMADNVLPMHRAGRGRRAPVSGHLFTVKDVADASGLPQPAIGQLVGRTWTDQGWMFTADQMQLAIDIAAERRGQASPAGSDTR